MAKSAFDETAETIATMLNGWSLSQEDTSTFLKLVIHLAETRLKPKRKAKIPSGAGLVWKTYAEAFKEAYKIEPPCNAKNMGMCGNLCKLVTPIEKALEITKFYLTQKDHLYLQTHHKLELLISDYNKLYSRLYTGQKISYKTAQALEKKANTQDAIVSYLKDKHKE